MDWVHWSKSEQQIILDQISKGRAKTDTCSVDCLTDLTNKGSRAILEIHVRLCWVSLGPSYLFIHYAIVSQQRANTFHQPIFASCAIQEQTVRTVENMVLRFVDDLCNSFGALPSISDRCYFRPPKHRICRFLQSIHQIVHQELCFSRTRQAAASRFIDLTFQKLLSPDSHQFQQNKFTVINITSSKPKVL
ncbi:hypothetical protein MPTK1_5g23250 [Marchantia polymorpha subsp. ruderalis]